MRRFLGFIVFFSQLYCLNAQVSWEYLTDLPSPLSNNAVVSATVNDTLFLYSFAGIDSTKKWSGIHKKTFRYNTETGIWSTLDDLPSGNGRIAAGASFVNDKIFIIGGYEVRFNGEEISYNLVHRFDPVTNSFLSDGAPLPKAIDDHVQAVWRDSLIYVITGWSNTTNAANVQIYNPSLDEWTVGTPVPSSAKYRVFGASGTIVNDTIYYIGGARYGSTFPPTLSIRKGAIDPADPSQINWSETTDSLSLGYRMGASDINGVPFWFGGSSTTYNYNGIAYNGSGGVDPTNNITFYDDNSLYRISEDENDLPPIMDLRGLAKGENGNFYVIGGMIEQQKVSKYLMKFQLPILSSTNEKEGKKNVGIYPNPTLGMVRVRVTDSALITLYDVWGRQIIKQHVRTDSMLDLRNMHEGVYFVEVFNRSGFKTTYKLVKI